MDAKQFTMVVHRSKISNHFPLNRDDINKFVELLKCLIPQMVLPSGGMVIGLFWSNLSLPSVITVSVELRGEMYLKYIKVVVQKRALQKMFYRGHRPYISCRHSMGVYGIGALLDNETDVKIKEIEERENEVGGVPILIDDDEDE